MKIYTTSASSVASEIAPDAMVSEAWEAVGASLERLCVIAGTSSLQKLMGEGTAQLGLNGPKIP
ncbi:MAG: hypothetical protein OXF88_21870 [Rhodobacteraceae bacterium]|nr:hypothetical protein [Paracoccaceae bacterium]MCY4140414.1 hypothetical protein [Paracoccaceae bacterium]